ncbi:MAG: HAD family phosphatase [Armatimonadetes bacterium]|nr:HAD family phosphatase [Armatimonadota bacterium]
MLKALIFDFDGVIVHSEPVHFLQFQRVLAEEGVAVSRAEYDAVYLGMTDRDCFITALERSGRTWSETLVNELIDRKTVYYQACRAQLAPLPGVETFVRRAAAHLPVAIGSGALRDDIDWVLTNLRLRDCFRVVVSAEDYERGKPDPECFLLTLARLNEGLGEPVAPGECLVIEDGRHGVTAAHAAGMCCLALTTSYTAAELAAADLVVPTLEGLDPIALAQQLE